MRCGGCWDASHSIVNDVLIALSARSTGATAMTQNEDRYQAIRTVSLSGLS